MEILLDTVIVEFKDTSLLKRMNKNGISRFHSYVVVEVVETGRWVERIEQVNEKRIRDLNIR